MAEMNVLRLFNTLTKRVEAFEPRDPERVTFYTCGPTVYDDAHIGNFRSFLAADVLRRFLESPMCRLQMAGGGGSGGGVHEAPGGRRVVHVMNITDVGHMTDDADGGENGEDRMAVAGRRLLEAKKAGKLAAGVDVDPKDPRQIARYFEGRFKGDAKRLGLKLVVEAEKDATLMPRATESIEAMIIVIELLMRRNYAYVVGDPGRRAVYFRVQSFRGYGKLSGNTLDRLREGAGGRVTSENQAGKEHAADFLLWKEDGSHIMRWPSPWGDGYPGWHIECTAMGVQRLALHPMQLARIETLREWAGMMGEPLIDLHSGGEDNIFPHHECEIAQSCCAFNAQPNGATYAKMWFHPRFLLVEGEKMSKSKGNFFTARDLFSKGHEPAAVRLELIKTHYRSNANFTEQGLKDSARMVERWRRVVDEGEKGAFNDSGKEAAARCRVEFADAMMNDLNIAAAIAAVNTWVGGIEKPTAADARLMKEIDAVLGVLDLERAASSESEIGMFIGVEPSPEVEAKLRERRDARARKDFAASDRLRDELAAMGYAIKDAKDGKVEVRRK
ncbi:MAG: hypothetical protein KF912_07100 [Phycisphaeraceae bacterium]|nr:hypothetical protein [Phycisphaeraceae bacterium]